MTLFKNTIQLARRAGVALDLKRGQECPRAVCGGGSERDSVFTTESPEFTESLRCVRLEFVCALWCPLWCTTDMLPLIRRWRKRETTKKQMKRCRDEVVSDVKGCPISDVKDHGGEFDGLIRQVWGVYLKLLQKLRILEEAE